VVLRAAVCGETGIGLEWRSRVSEAYLLASDKCEG
jgi:hypothetical protein